MSTKLEILWKSIVLLCVLFIAIVIIVVITFSVKFYTDNNLQDIDLSSLSSLSALQEIDIGKLNNSMNKLDNINVDELNKAVTTINSL